MTLQGRLAWHDGRKVDVRGRGLLLRRLHGRRQERVAQAGLPRVLHRERQSRWTRENLVIEFRKPLPEFRAYPVLTFKIIPATYKGQKLSTESPRGRATSGSSPSRPMGTGPFVHGLLGDRQVGLLQGQPEKYFRRKPAAESLVLQNIIDPVIRMNEFQQKRINLILETSPADRESVEKMGNVHISSFMPYSFYQVALNAKIDALKSEKARAALASVVDPAKLVPGITDRDKLALINYGPFPANLFSRNFADYKVSPLSDPRIKGADAVKKAIADAGLTGKKFALLFPDSMGAFGQSVAEGLASQFAAAGVTVEVKRTGDQVFKRLVFGEKNYDLALQYCDGFDNLYSDLEKYYTTKGSLNVYGIADKDLDALFAKWNATVVTADWIEATRALHDKISAAAPVIPLFSLEKDVYSRGINNIKIASDNPFLSAEDWSQGGK